MNLSDILGNGDLSDIDSLNLSNVLDEGLLTMGFNPYILLLGDFFWGLFFGIIGLAIYTWKSNIYALIGYLVAVIALAKVVLGVALGDLFVILLGLAISSLIYNVFVKKKEDA